MSVHVELYATGNAAPEHAWAVVSDPWRLPEWTDADRVERVEPHPVEVGTELVVVHDGDRQLWRIVTTEPRLLEATADTARGRLGIGVRVVRERDGSRLVLAGAFHPHGAMQKLRVRALDAPALRRRFDRWSRAALDLAAQLP